MLSIMIRLYNPNNCHLCYLQTYNGLCWVIGDCEMETSVEKDQFNAFMTIFVQTKI